MSADPGTSGNPYRPGAGLSPLLLAGREGELRRFAAMLRAAPAVPANLRLTGLRGVGKTVLLKEFDRLAAEAGWLTSRMQLEQRHNAEERLASLVVGLADQAEQQVSRTARLREKLRGAARQTVGALQISYEDVSLTMDPSAGAHQRTMSEALLRAAEVAVNKGLSGYLLLLDEAQALRDDGARGGEHPLSMLIAALNGLQDHEVPVGIVLCGLPTLRANLLRARTYTERMFRGEEIGRLTEEAASEALTAPLEATAITATDGLVARVVAEVEGYPYFIQLWGAELWDAAQLVERTVFDEQLLSAIEGEIYDRLDRDFYGGRLETLTPAEQDLLLASAACPYPPLRSADMRACSGKSEANVNVLMGRLVEQGVLFRARKGIYDFTAPRFHNFLKRRLLSGSR